MRALLIRLYGLPFFLLSLLPFSVLYFISDLSFFVLYHITHYRRKVVRRNLRNSFPGRTSEEIETIEKEFYHHLCDIMFETIKSLTMGEKEIRRRFRVRNPELLERYYEKRAERYPLHGALRQLGMDAIPSSFYRIQGPGFLHAPVQRFF